MTLLQPPDCVHEPLIRHDGTRAVCSECDRPICERCGWCIPVLFRPQRGGLQESLQAVRPVASIEAIEQSEGVRVLAVTPYAQDPRIGWDTHLVLAEYPDGTHAPVGFTSGPLGREDV